jgi:2-furoyl-CoA dehydrogenase FAD binding subunit
VKPPALDYIRADSAEEAVALLAEYGGDARILAGGQSLMAVLNMRIAQPRALVDIHRAADLGAISNHAANDAANGAGLRIGAAVTQATLQRHPDLARSAPLVAQALPHLGHYQTRNRGTVCGSLAHADPSAELPLCLATLDGEVVMRSARGRRTVAAPEFFTGMLQTACAADELVEAAHFPAPATGERHGFVEMSIRHGDFAIVALAAVVGADAIRLGVGGVADHPVVARWPRLAGTALDDALNQLAWDLGARDDHHASARYRRHLVRTLGRSLIAELAR